MKRLLTALLILTGAATAGDFPWSDAPPADIIRHSVQPDQVMDEVPCNWRPVITPIMAPEARKCSSAREAVLRIASNIGKLTGAYYSQERRKHNMNALEALEEKKISCTGQSILLVCALRAVDIPARAVGVHTWNHLEGNHTWAEAWFDGAWHMIEFNEKDFNTPWVMEYVGLLNPKHPHQRIRAVTPGGNTTWWSPLEVLLGKRQNFRAEDVTERYQELSREWYAEEGLPECTQRILIDLQPRTEKGILAEILNEKGQVISSGKLPTSRDDMRYFTRLTMPREGKHYLRLFGSPALTFLPSTAAPVQVLRLKR